MDQTPSPVVPPVDASVAAAEAGAGPSAGDAGLPSPGARRAHPLLWVPTLYFAMGTPNIAVSVVAAIMYKNLGVSNRDIALYTGSMYLPWALKPLWAPLVEMFRTKKFFVLAMELVMAATLSGVAFALPLPSFMTWTLALFWVTGFASATQDIAADGVYIGAMAPKEQAAYAGVQGIFWSLGRIIASGLLVSFTGMLHGRMQMPWTRAWMIVMVIMGGIMALSALWHARFLPSGDRAADAPQNFAQASQTFVDAFRTFFTKRSIALMIAVVFFYRFGEGLIEKIGPLFMLDTRSAGGLGLDNVALGNINGTWGTTGFVLGALLGGLFAAKLGLRRAFFLLALALNVPHVTYLYLSQARPESVLLITLVVTIEKFGYGFGSVGHMLYMMQQLAPGPYRTAHYAFATGIMALSMMFTGMISGALQEALGYQVFFLVVLAASLPPIVFAKLAPFHVAAAEGRAAAPVGH